MSNISLLVTDGISGEPQRSRKCILADRLGMLTF